MLADNKLTFQLREKLIKGYKYICGIAWKSKNEKIGNIKSLDLKMLEPILKIPGINFVNLQYGDVETEISSLKESSGLDIKIINEIDNYKEIDKLASLISACDFIITTSNVTAHISGAIGKETYILLPYSQGNIWYWHYGDKKSLWYPSIWQYAQEENNDWSKPINEIYKVLKNYEI